MERTLTKEELRTVSKELRAQGRKLPKSMRRIELPEAVAQRLGARMLCHGGASTLYRNAPADSTDFWITGTL